MQVAHPPASRHTQHSVAQKDVIFSPCSHFDILILKLYDIIVSLW